MRIVLLLLMLITISVITNGQIVSTVDGKTFHKIVIAPDAPDTVKLAASELKKYLESACKADLTIVNKSSDKTGNIYVGISTALEKQGFSVKDFKPDAFRIVAKDGNLYIWGRDYSGPPVYGMMNPWREIEVYNSKLKLGAFGEAGTLYGVYYFLEKFVGIRWYMPGELGTVIPEKKEIKIPDVNISKSPDFNYRYPWLCYFEKAPENALWFRRTGFGGRYPVQIIHAFLFFRKYKDSHPEYFALVDGKRDFTNKCASRGGGHLCLTNPDVVKQWVKDICAYFKSHPEQGVFPLSPNDGLTRICGCPKCQAELNRNALPTGKHSNHIWGFVNKVAVEVAKKYPDKLIGCIAYEHFIDPPSNIAELSPNVAVMICKRRGNFIDPKYKSDMRKRIEKWLKKSKNIYFWEYYLDTWLPWRNLPVIYPHIISEDLKYLKRIKSGGEFIEAESWYGNTPRKMIFPGMQHINLYVTGKLYWDADQDIDQLLDEYFRLFYGPAEKEMKQFWTLAEKARVENGKKVVKAKFGSIDAKVNPADIFPRNILDKLSSILTQAKSKTKPDSKYYKRIELIENEFKIGRRTVSQVLRKSPPVMAIPQTETPIRIDAFLSEKIYQKITPQSFVDKGGESTPYKTFLYAAHDKKNLYFAFINFDPETNKLHCKSTQRDKGSIWEDDCIEIFIYPDSADHKKCYQFIINAKGVIWDGRHGFSNDGRVDSTWDSEVKTKTFIQKNRWIMEIAIPLKDIGISGAGKQKILANFYRSRVASGNQIFSCWSPIMTNRHLSPERFGLLELKGTLSHK